MHFFADLSVFLHVMAFVKGERNNTKAVGESANVIWKMKDFYILYFLKSFSMFFTYLTLTSVYVT